VFYIKKWVKLDVLHQKMGKIRRFTSKNE